MLQEVSPWSIQLIFCGAILIGGFQIARSALLSLKSRTIGIDLLMTIAVLGAAAIGEWIEGAAVVVLFSLGETLEAFTMDRTRRSIRGLMNLTPAEARVRRNDHELILNVREIIVGDVLLVKPGEKLAMDGVVLSGHSYINQAPITGESIPVEKSIGDEVFAGTMNQQGALEIQVTRLHEDNTISRIIQLVEEAQAQKAPSQRFVDVFAKYYTPAVIVLAMFIVIIPVLLLQQPFEAWLYRALMLLVVACPCALVISTPVSIISAIGNAARNGILIKGGAYLEQLGAISAIAFDKTGTLTKGVPHVTQLITLETYTDHEVIQWAAAIEAHSEHPLAAAILRLANERGVDIIRADDFLSITGMGAKGSIDGHAYYVGSTRWFRNELKLPLERIEHDLARLEASGETVILLGTDQEVVGIFALADQLRDEAIEVVHQLQRMGIAEIKMLTGDHEGTARAIASRFQQIQYAAELLPEEKVQAIQAMMNQKGTSVGVAMVGDGINDAPALASATVGIAMGAAGTDTALETADVALMSDDLTKLPYAIRLGQRTLRIIKQNIMLSLLVKALFFVLIFSGHSTLWMAVLADTGTSLLVIANGMRLLRKTEQSLSF